MDAFYLTSAALPRLSLLVLTVAVLAYFAVRIRQSPGTGWLALALGGFALHHAAFVGFDTVFVPTVLRVLYGLSWSSVFLAAWAFIGVSYAFLGERAPSSSRRVLAVTGALALAAAVFVHLGFGPLRDRVSSSLLQWTGAVTVLGLGATVIVILSRRSRRRVAGALDEHRRKAFRTFLGTIGAGLLIPVFGVLRDLGLVSSQLVEQVSLVLWAITMVGLVTLYVNYDPAPTSFLAKVVSFAVVAVVTALGVGSVVAFPSQAPAPGAPPGAVRFVPDGGGFRIVAGGADAEPRGEPVVIGGAQEVALGFAFPFADTTWTIATVDDDGIVVFGDHGLTSTWELVSGTPAPWIAPLLIALDTDRVLVFRQPGEIAITWHEAPLANGGGQVTAQLVLRETGEVAFGYEGVPEDIGWGRGLSPGPARPLHSAVAPGVRLPPGVGVAEVRWARQLAADQRRSMPYAGLLVGAALFVLLAFPLYLREGLTRPLHRLLDGVRRAARGHLSDTVPVGARDEIGVLTEDFNRMTGSLRSAETELRRYADELEDRVAERTAELAASLDELKAAQARLIQQEKLASLGQLTAGIAHEIKNPLNFVTNFADLSVELAEELAAEADPDEQRALLADLKANAQKIAEHGRRADAIVRSMMAHARTRGGDRRPTDLDALVAEYSNLAYHGMRARHPDATIDLVQVLGSVGEVDMAGPEIGRVLINLLDNAFDAVRQRSARDEGHAPRVTVTTVAAPRHVEIRVGDNGTGMAPDVAARVFEPFFTTKPTGEGTGLGLSMSYDIVTQGHGGTLTVESVEGEGTTFVISLPRS